MATPVGSSLARARSVLEDLERFTHRTFQESAALRSLACLPRIRRLAVGQAHQLQSFVGLTNLGSLKGEGSGEGHTRVVWLQSLVGLTNRRSLRVRSKSRRGGGASEQLLHERSTAGERWCLVGRALAMPALQLATCPPATLAVSQCLSSHICTTCPVAMIHLPLTPLDLPIAL